MNTITITFSQTSAVAPKYIITDCIAVQSDCQPEAWATGLVVGLHLEELFEPRWWYICKLDSPLGLTEEYLDTDLVPENKIPTLQAEWEQAEANLCPQCDGSGTLDNGYTFQSHTCSSCAGTGIKDYAKTLPPASMKLH